MDTCSQWSVLLSVNMVDIRPHVLQHNDECVLLLRMLALGLGAWHMIDSQQFKESKLVGISRATHNTPLWL